MFCHLQPNRKVIVILASQFYLIMIKSRFHIASLFISILFIHVLLGIFYTGYSYWWITVIILAYIFILFLDEKNIEIYVEKIKRILNTFTTSKKDIEAAVLTIYSMNVLIEYILGKTDYEDVIFRLWNTKKANLNLYIKFWLGWHMVALLQQQKLKKV